MKIFSKINTQIIKNTQFFGRLRPHSFFNSILYYSSLLRTKRDVELQTLSVLPGSEPNKCAFVRVLQLILATIEEEGTVKNIKI